MILILIVLFVAFFLMIFPFALWLQRRDERKR